MMQRPYPEFLTSGTMPHPDPLDVRETTVSLQISHFSCIDNEDLEVFGRRWPPLVLCSLLLLLNQTKRALFLPGSLAPELHVPWFNDLLAWGWDGQG